MEIEDKNCSTALMFAGHCGRLGAIRILLSGLRMACVNKQSTKAT